MSLGSEEPEKAYILFFQRRYFFNPAVNFFPCQQAQNFPEEPAPEPEMLEPLGESAYDFLLPRSIAYRPVLNAERTGPRSLMPLVEVLREGAETKEAGWHRNAERAARGLPAVENISNHMEPWEKQLVCLSASHLQLIFRLILHVFIDTTRV